VGIFKKQNTKLGIVAAITAYFFFRADIVLGKALLENFSPLTVTFGTLLMASMITLTDLEQRREVKKLFQLKTKAGHTMLTVAFLSAVLAPLTFFLGLKSTSGINVVLFMNTWTILFIILGIIFLGEKFSFHALIGIILMIVGVGAIATNGFSESIHFTRGDIWVFISAIFIASGNFLIKQRATYTEPHLYVAARCTIGAIILGPLVLFLYPHEITNFALLKTYLPHFMGYALFVVLIGYTLSFWAIRQLSTKMYGTIGLLGPVIGITYSIIFLGEKLLTFHILGALLILSGLFVVHHHRHIHEKKVIAHHGQLHHH
jgi:drug/metabolite transporter (DMT)-like permease